MKKLAIIPAYNECESIYNTVQEIRSKAPSFDYVVINDSSTDSTLEILKEKHIPYLNLPVNLGIGGAVQTGYQYALRNGYDLAVQVDGDGQHDAAFLNVMAEFFEQDGEKPDMVIGSRFIKHEGFQSSPARRIGIGYFTWLIRRITGQTITDPTSGLRMVGRSTICEFAEHYPSDYPEPESVIVLLKKKKKVVEVPVIMRERQGGTSSIHLKKSIYYMVKVSIAMLVESVRAARVSE